MPKLEFVDPRKLWKNYVLALLLIFVLITFSHFVAIFVNGDAGRHAQDINDSGKQRMLSQRILFFASEFRASGYQNAEAGEQMRKTIELFRANHEELISTDIRPLPQEVADLYFGAPALDEIVRGFIASTDAQFTQFDALRDGTYLFMQRMGSTELLIKLNQVVEAFEAHARTRSEKAEFYGYVGYALAVLVLFLEAIVIFRPAHRTIVDAIEELELSNEQFKAQEADAFAALEESEEAWLEADEARAATEAATQRTNAHLNATRTELERPLAVVQLALEEAQFKAPEKEVQDLLNHAQSMCLLSAAIAKDIALPQGTQQLDQSNAKGSFCVARLCETIRHALPILCPERSVNVHFGSLESDRTDVQGDMIEVLRVVAGALAQFSDVTGSMSFDAFLDLERTEGTVALDFSIRDRKLRLEPIQLHALGAETLHLEASGTGISRLGALMDRVGGSLKTSSTKTDGTEMNLTLQFVEQARQAPSRKRRRNPKVA